MSVKQDYRPKNNIIRRFQSTSDETPPWAGISFVQPIDSDQLSEQLKGFYPEGKTLRQRKHMAAIDFLQRELEQMQSQTSSAPDATENADRLSTSSPRSEMHSFREPYVQDSRPQSAASQTPPSVASSQASPRLAERTRQTANGTLTSGPPSPLKRISGSQTFVFSALDGKPMQPKTKRKMTTQERHAYKETRRRGACENCKRTKAKVCFPPQLNTSRFSYQV